MKKRDVVNDIESDLQSARIALAKLPRSSAKAVELSLEYYDRLLDGLKRASANELKRRRLRVSNKTKLLLYAKAKVTK